MRKSKHPDPFLASIPDALTEDQLLTFLLAYSEEDPAEKANALLNQYGDLANLLDTRQEELLLDNIIPTKSVSLVRLVSELHRRYLLIRSHTETRLLKPSSYCNYFLPMFVGHGEEMVFLLCMDDFGKVLRCFKLAEGDIHSTQLSARNLVKEALRVNATTVVLAHNHPCGPSIPSRADIQTTRMLQDILASLDIRLLDHVIFFNDSFCSMVEGGYFRP